MENFEKELTGGHPNSLGNTIAVVEAILLDTSLFDELFQCYFSADEVVRLRTSNAIKRISKSNKSLLLPYLDRLLNEILLINQASTQWTLAQLLLSYTNELSDEQLQKAKLALKNNLKNYNDWIVLNTTMDTLFQWSKKDEELSKWLKPHLEKLEKDTRKSVAKKATKLLASF